MPNRTIRESCRTSESLDKLSDAAERLHWRLVTVADDYGRFNADPSVVKSLCFPLRADVRMCKHVRTCLDEMEKAGLIVRYWDDSSGTRKNCAYYPNWEASNGSPRAKRSKFGVPTSANICSHMRANVPDLRSSDLDLRSTISRPSEGQADPTEFERFWSAYPKKRKIGDAEKAWRQTSKVRPPLGDVLEAIARQRTSDEWLKDSGQFIPLPASWLRAKCWLDAPSDNGHTLRKHQADILDEVIADNVRRMP